ncbi:binding-protein-dependent transporters inner membrane component [Natrinema pellirubrum DSM 15624]|uniref:ABC-type dipeptide/oligopeptide/nickel transport system, permease component n=1 Tax=Natrinema pellirubrum (strain DSM 15624 / CIP 106293 / JCM 10476 / NCIMB 786 / 157) TaxID=797303 RepID=L0JNI5_NATP1|nr:ABC transporter permease [Natrinema pellirubrum]AGB32799.1 ABC-type dipeptide/oligopeptide/nickel transport system, permease component [Natrinema pellirubrum DSM 15624]ELY75802.1 binding-protein-dependent transporters inner membrane component [Natrinema pellirubrum DSM 15624]
MSMSTSFEPNETTDESRPLRKRVADNPDPARFWLLGTAVLVALEFGRFMGWAYQLVGAVKYVIGLVGLLPSWIGDSVGEATVPIVSYFVSDAITLLLLFGLSVLVTRFTSWSATDRFDVGLSDRIVRFLERAVLTAVLATIAVLLAFTPVGGLVDGAIDGVFNTLSSLPTLTSREVISNQGHRTPGGGWDGTFLGLSPAVAWGIRTLLVYGYALAVIVWTWKGYTIFREHYRQADWTPRDDTLGRFRSHYWGQFGLIVVLMFIVTALWAPAISPTTADQNIASPYEYEVEYLTDDGEVATTTPGQANLNSQSNGQNTIGPMSYDDYDRWAPLGTTSSGQNLLTHIAYGAQTSLVIGLLAIGLGGLIAVTMSMLTAYYKGLVDVLTVIASDTIISIPAFLLVMMLSVIFNQGNHPIAEPLNGGVLLGLIFAFVYWPGMWRTIRGPSLQVAEEEWVDAARSYGQSPVNTMRKHMAPYIAGYIMIYGSLLLGGIIISTAALSFLGLGIEGSTPEWGRLVSDGRSFVGTSSWHVATIPGLMIVLVVTAFNALGDGLRDAIDPEADTGGTDDTGTAAAGGGG